ncbi:MAG: DUF2442 domain-containing protein [Proteobacteria bacterium]|nr:DUF2442 domain-containing protein [Pseudomonadota bacterium]
MKAITLKAARIVGTLALELQWSTGETLRANLAGWLRPPMEALCDPDFFARLQVDDWGTGLNWPGGLDLGADTLYALCREQAGLPTAREFNAWMVRNGLSLQGAADSLGMTRRMIAHYRTGSRAIPRVVGLACLGWEAQHRHA